MTSAPSVVPSDPFKSLGFVPEPNPGWPLPPVDEMRRHLAEHPEEFCKWLRERQTKIERAAKDPLRHGYEPAIWHIVDDLLCRGKKVVLIDPADSTPREIIAGSEVYLSGANRSSKSEYGGRTIVKHLVEKRHIRAWCFHANGPRSVMQQQPRVYKFIPPEWKAIRKHPIAYIRYKPANGFTGEPPTFVGPNHSQCWFMNYSMDVHSLEGDEIDIAWMTELMPWEFVEAVRFRLAQRAGKLILDFTPADGYTPTVAMLTEEARDIVRVEAPLLPHPKGGFETVPRIRKANPKTNPNLSIAYFHLSDNPFANAQEVITVAKAGGRKKILERVYGVAEKLAGNQFPTFDKAVHVITGAQWRQLQPHCGPAKQYVDPCSGRNWASLWAARTGTGQVVIYREWPSPGVPIRGVGDPGPWAVFDARLPDGKKGDAQKPWGFGLERNAEEILLAEGWTEPEIAEALERANCRVRPVRKQAAVNSDRGVVNGGTTHQSRITTHQSPEWIYERMMDSRFGNTPTHTRGEMRTLIELMSDLGLDFEPTPGEHQREGIEAIQDLLYFDADQPQSIDNRPTLLIVDSCQNLIWALQNWTGLDGAHGACKDWIDLLRYMALSPPDFFRESDLKPITGGAY